MSAAPARARPHEDETLVRTPRERRLDVLRASREWFETLGSPPPRRSIGKS